VLHTDLIQSLCSTFSISFWLASIQKSGTLRFMCRRKRRFTHTPTGPSRGRELIPLDLWAGLTHLNQHTVSCYASIPGIRAFCFTELAVSSLAKTTASTHCTYPPASEMTYIVSSGALNSTHSPEGWPGWVVWINTRMVDLPEVITNPSANWTRPS